MESQQSGLEQPAESAVSSIHLEAASTMAVIAASTTPLVYLDADFTIIAASLSFGRAFGFPPETIRGRKLADLGQGEWNAPQLVALLKATAAGLATIEAYEFDLKRSGETDRRLVLNSHKLQYDENEPVRLLLAVTDVTEARAAALAKDELLREKATLLREVQHRVANSLQIIASILMQSARRIQSDEARGYLKSAHDRVISLASLQLQLSRSETDDVALKPYLRHLCESLSASMIQDERHTAIRVTVDETVLPANVSVSLGLIVTELVINALKHAFPDNRAGLITIDYQASGGTWTLVVSDDGIGMPDPASETRAGLGTSIVEALARQLEATVVVSDVGPGTRITVEHRSETPVLERRSL